MSYFELLEENSTLFFSLLLISLMLTVLVYGAFPFIFAKTRKTPITKKKYKRLCYGINIIGLVFFFVINGAASGGPYFLWTWIFSNSGAKTLLERGIMIDDDYLPDNSNHLAKHKSCEYKDKTFFDTAPKCDKNSKAYVYPNKESAPNIDKVCFCRNCGHKLLEDSLFCSKCGTKVIFEAEEKVMLAVEENAKLETEEKKEEPIEKISCPECGEDLFFMGWDKNDLKEKQTCPFCGKEFLCYK